MRKIEFRGKGINDGEWYYGWLSIIDDDYYINHEEHISQGEWDSSYDDYVGELVKPDTIGQYTGLTDKNGTKIFEGDIIKINEQYTRVVRYSEVKASFVTCNENEWVGYLKDYSKPVRVIGNIYDNSELLKN
jgi:uncharacterized phage protein (TIGR01671 family)